jgi:hypothetical protein
VNKTDDIEALLWQVREAASCLICASGANCSSPADCLHWAGEHIAKANQIIAGGPMRVTVFERGEGDAVKVTDDAFLQVVLDGGETVMAGSYDIRPS